LVLIARGLLALLFWRRRSIGCGRGEFGLGLWRRGRPVLRSTARHPGFYQVTDFRHGGGIGRGRGAAGVRRMSDTKMTVPSGNVYTIDLPEAEILTPPFSLGAGF